MTWKRELAFWTFMFVVSFWFLWALIVTGNWVADHWGAYVLMRAER